MDIGRIPPVQSAVPENDPPEASRTPEPQAAPSNPPQTSRRDQLFSEGCWEVPNGSIQCPSWHPVSQPYPIYQETADGFAVGMHDPSVISSSAPERMYEFHHQGDGSYIYRDPDGVNWVIIHADGRMDDNSRDGCGILPFQNPCIPHYIWSEIEQATREVRRQMAERYDNSITREALDNLFQDLSDSIGRHPEWSLVQQHDFLFRRWDECREDSVGNEARTIILQYILEHYPQGSPLEFTVKELRGFNERRQTESQLFYPYPA